MSSQRKKEYSKRKKRKKHFTSDTDTATADDSYFGSSLASSSDESEGESDSRKYGRKKMRSYKISPPKKFGLRKSREFKENENDDDDENFEHSLYRTNGKLSLQTISSLNNSKTILSALQSLQNKIQNLEEERDRYKNECNSYEQGRTDEVDKRKEDRLLYLQEKEEIMKERNHLSEQLILSQEKVNQMETQLSQFENHTSSLREDLRDAQVKLRDKDDRNMELSRKIIELETDMEKGKEQDDQKSRKIDELSRFVVKERRKIERLEQQNSRLNASIQNLVDIGKNNAGMPNKNGKKKKSIKKRKKFVTGGGMYNHDQQQVNPRTFLKGQGWTENMPPSTIKKKPRRKVVGGKGRKGGQTRVATGPKRKKMMKKKKKKGKIWAIGSGNMKERLFRANLKRPVPFITSGNPTTSFNTNSIAQKGLNMGITDKKNISSIEKSDSTILPASGEAFSDNTSTVSTDPSIGLADEVGQDHAESVLLDIKKEYDSLAVEYKTLLGKVRTGEEVKVTQKLKAVGELMKRKERQMQKLKSYHQSVNSSLLNRPRIRGAKKRIKALKLFRNLKKISTM